MNAERDLLISADRADAQRRTLYTRIARPLRWSLIIILPAALAFIILWPEMNRITPEKLREQQKDLPPVSSNELVKPRFESTDKDGQPYTVSADRAVQDAADPDLLHLEKPVADLSLKGGTWLALSAETGIYRQKAGTIDLAQNVKLFEDSGYELLTGDMAIDFNAQLVETKSAVNGHGPMGAIAAASLVGSGETGILIFRGPATLTLNQSVLQ